MISIACVKQILIIDYSQVCEYVGDYEPVRSVFKSHVGCGLPVAPREEVGLLLCFMYMALSFLLGCLGMSTVMVGGLGSC